MNRLAELLEQITLPEIQRLLRRTVYSAIALAVVALVLSGLLSHLVFGLGVSLGLALGTLNVRLITRQTAKASASGRTRVRALASLTLFRLGATTAVIVVLAVVATQLGLGAVGGVALFYFVFLANLVVPLARKGFAA